VKLIHNELRSNCQVKLCDPFYKYTNTVLINGRVINTAVILTLLNCGEGYNDVFGDVSLFFFLRNYKDVSI